VKDSIEIKDGNLVVDVQSVVENLDDKSRKLLCQHLAFNEFLLKAVVETVATGECFEDEDSPAWWWGGTDNVPSLNSLANELRKRLLPLLSEIPAKVVRAALSDAKEAKASEARHRDWAWEMYHAWPSEHLRVRPDISSWVYVDGASEEDTRRYMDERSEA